LLAREDGIGFDEADLADRLCTDQWERWSAGERVSAEDYRARHPALEADREALFELIYGEYLIRESLGESPAPAEYVGRFPEFAERLSRQLCCHRALGPLPPPAALAPPGDSTGAAAPSPVLPGYEVLEELGRGGMGVVYLARNCALNRLCALKMIQGGAYVGTAAAARFQAEAEAIARLRHPDIVQVYHVGEANGLPFLELEYLPGGSLDQTLDGTPRPCAETARLVEVLARAIAEAHRRGIIHRDLKPANILLDADAHPKVADFGLAKILDSDHGLTRTQTVLGSPSYMAPEQADGRALLVGPATDVYALGAILYELLTGRPPFRAATALETLAQVKETEPIPPSRLQPGLPRDLQTICLRCLEKAPSRRYGTAEALADDFRRYLAGEPILARPTPAWERAWKWARRRPTLAAALAVSGWAVVLLLAGAFYYNARLRVAVLQARTAERAAVEQRNLAMSALNQLIFNVQEKLAKSPATRPLRQSLLDTALAGLDDIARSTEAAAPDLSRAVAHEKLGDIFRQVGRAQDARRQYEQARQLAEGLAVAAPADLAITKCLREAYLGLGELDLLGERTAEAKKDFHRVVDLAEAIAAAEPTSDAARSDQIVAYSRLGHAYNWHFELAEAEALYRKMHDLAVRWVAVAPANTQARDMLASSYYRLAGIRGLADDFPAARADYLKAIAIGREALASEPENAAFQTHPALALHDLAVLAHDRLEFAEARPRFREAEQLLTKLVQADPEDLETQLLLVHVQYNFGRLERDELRFERALAIYRPALERLLKLDREGRLEGRPAFKHAHIDSLKTELADCSDPSMVAGDLEAIRSRPPRVASRLLRIRARAMAAQGRQTEFKAMAEALYALEATEAEDLWALARSLGECILYLDGVRWADSSATPLEALRQRCAERAVALLARAVEAGFRNVKLIERNNALKPLRQHPTYPDNWR
jgi:tetratricopeptide (TPR) repeat protein